MPTAGPAPCCSAAGERPEGKGEGSKKTKREQEAVKVKGGSEEDRLVFTSGTRAGQG